MKRLFVNGLFAALVVASGLAVQSGIAFGAASTSTVVGSASSHAVSDRDRDRDKDRDRDHCKKTHHHHHHGPHDCDDE